MHSHSEASGLDAALSSAPRSSGQHYFIAGQTIDPIDLVDRIYAGQNSGLEDLYRIISERMRYFLRHVRAQEVQDRLHDSFVMVVKAIQNGELRHPDRLLGFVRTIVQRQAAAHVVQAVFTGRKHLDLDARPFIAIASDASDPEKGLALQQRDSLISQVLKSMSRREREILTLFYLDGHSTEEICGQLGMTHTRFRLLKSRAKARFGELGQAKVQPRVAPAMKRTRSV